MVLAVFDTSFAKRQESRLARKRARYRLALASSFMLLCRKQQCAGDTHGTAAFSMTKAVFLELVDALALGPPILCSFIFDLIDADGNGAVEMLEFEKLLFVCRCCNLLVADRLMCHKVVVARALHKVEESSQLLGALPARHEFSQARESAEALQAESKQFF